MDVIVQDVLVSYDSVGDGFPLLFIHGWMDNKETWRHLIEGLKPNFRCIAVDLPNFGSSSSTEHIVTIENYADCLRQFIQKVGLKSYALVGHSMGGQIAIYGTGSGLLAPKELILIASAGIRNENSHRKSVLRLVSKPVGKIIPKTLKRKIYHIIGSDYNPDLSVLHKIIIDQMLSTDVQSEAAQISVPTLLVYGGSDTSTPPRHGQKLHQWIKGSNYHEIITADHWLHQQNASQVAGLIKEFLK